MTAEDLDDSDVFSEDGTAEKPIQLDDDVSWVCSGELYINNNVCTIFCITEI